MILLVEDDRDDEDLTIRALRKHGITSPIVVARDGAEAIDVLSGTGVHSTSSLDDLPRVVFLDLNLPKLTGLDVLRRIRAQERTKLLPVVILTSSSEDQDVARAYALGANSYVRKPVGFKEFGDAVRSLGAYWLELNRGP